MKRIGYFIVWLVCSILMIIAMCGIAVLGAVTTLIYGTKAAETWNKIRNWMFRKDGRDQNDTL